MALWRQVLEHLALSEHPDVPPQHMLQPDSEGLSKARAEVERFKVGLRLVWHAGTHRMNTYYYRHLSPAPATHASRLVYKRWCCRLATRLR